MQLALAETKASAKDCITVGGLVAVLIGDTASAAGRTITAGLQTKTEQQEIFESADEGWSTWLKESVANKTLLVREVATLAPSNSTHAVKHWTESNTTAIPDYVAALAVLKADARRWLTAIGIPLPPSLQGTDEAAPLHHAPARETTEQRRQRRYQMCVEAGLVMPTNDYAALPRGIGRLAEQEGISRQAFTDDVKAHIRRLNPRNGS